MISRSRRLLITVLPLTALPLALVACGSGGDGSSTPDRTMPTAAATNLVDTCRPGESSDSSAFVEATRNASAKAKTFHLAGTVTLPLGTSAASGQMEGDADVSDPTNPKMTVKITTAGQSVEVLFIDKAAFMQVPGGDTYLKYPLTDQELGAFTQLNAADSIEKTKNSMTDLRCVGTEDVNGTTTGHYRYQTDPKALLGTGTGTESTTGITGPPATVEVWVGSDNLPVKMVTDAAGAPSTFEYSRYGEPVSITAPDPAKVQTIPDAGSIGTS
ncbi:MAG: hypothetical protein ABI746_01410 [Dermatophilaceae bacterium]